MSATLALAVVAAGIGSLHTLAPDHWVPFAALARAEGWSSRRTAVITAMCGLGHVTVSVALGLISVLAGLELIRAIGQQLEQLAGLLLIAFGIAYGLWGLHRAVRDRIHKWLHDVLPAHQHSQAAHHHHHQHVDEKHGRRTAWALFLLFSADPCVAVVPLMLASVPLGWGGTLAVVMAYEAATIATMVGLAVPARAAASTVHGEWVDRYGDALAGGVITIVGVVVAVMGI